MVARPVRAQGSLDRVEGFPDGAFGERVEMDLEPQPVQGRHEALEGLRIDEGDPALIRDVAVGVEVGLQHGGRERLAHAVLHDLHARRGEAPGAASLAERDQFVDLLRAAIAIPPQGADDARGEIAALPRSEVGGVVVHPRPRGHDGVLPGRDPQGVQVPLPLEQSLVDLRGRRDGRQVAHQVGGTFVEGAARLAVRVALDPAVGRIGRGRRDAGHLERAAVHPRAVAVPVRQDHDAVGHDRIEEILRRCPAREHVHRPAAAEDPLAFRVRLRVRPHGFHVAIGRMEVVEIALQPIDTAADRVDVRVLEAGHQHPSAKIEHLRGRVDPIAYVVVAADRHDPSVLHRDGARAGPSRVHRVHGAVHEGEFGRAHRRSIAVRRARRGRGGPRSSSRDRRPASTGHVPG